MKVSDNEKPQMITNFEVFKALEEHQTEIENLHKHYGTKSGSLFNDKNLKSFVEDSKNYLNPMESVCASTYENIKEVFKLCENYNLTRAETLQVLNNRPTQYIQLYLIVEHLEERLSEEKAEQLLKELQTLMPLAEVEVESS